MTTFVCLLCWKFSIPNVRSVLAVHLCTVAAYEHWNDWQTTIRTACFTVLSLSNLHRPCKVNRGKQRNVFHIVVLLSLEHKAGQTLLERLELLSFLKSRWTTNWMTLAWVCMYECARLRKLQQNESLTNSVPATVVRTEAEAKHRCQFWCVVCMRMCGGGRVVAVGWLIYRTDLKCAKGSKDCHGFELAYGFGASTSGCSQVNYSWCRVAKACAYFIAAFLVWVMLCGPGWLPSSSQRYIGTLSKQKRHEFCNFQSCQPKSEIACFILISKWFISFTVHRCFDPLESSGEFWLAIRATVSAIGSPSHDENEINNACLKCAFKASNEVEILVAQWTLANKSMRYCLQNFIHTTNHQM